MRTELEYLPPWRERLANGRLSPEYGPRTLGEYEGAMEAFAASTAGGGLWDAAEEPRARAPRHDVTRHDGAAVAAYVERHSAQIPPRELEIYFAYFRDRLSVGACARRLGVTVAAAGMALLRLRRRCAGEAS